MKFPPNFEKDFSHPDYRNHGDCKGAMGNGARDGSPSPGWSLRSNTDHDTLPTRTSDVTQVTTLNERHSKPASGEGPAGIAPCGRCSPPAGTLRCGGTTLGAPASRSSAAEPRPSETETPRLPQWPYHGPVSRAAWPASRDAAPCPPGDSPETRFPNPTASVAALRRHLTEPAGHGAY